MLIPYGFRLANAPPDDWLMILPPPRAIIDGTHARVQSSAPVRFTVEHAVPPVERKSMSDSCGSSAISPALLTRMSIPPNASIVAAAIAAVDVLARDVGLDADGSDAARLERLGRLARLVGLDVGEHDRGPGLAERARVFAADASGGARDHRDLALQRETHRRLSVVSIGLSYCGANGRIGRWAVVAR